MTNQVEEKIGIIGAGRLGASLARALCEVDCSVAAICDRKKGSALRCAALCKQYTEAYSLNQLPRDLTLIFISVPDDSIESIAQKLAESYAFSPKTIIAHTSGALDSTILSPLRSHTTFLASIHPVQTFSGTDSDWKRLFRIHYGLEGSFSAIARLKKIVKRLYSDVLVLSRNQKTLYHISCVYASNYLIASMSAATHLANIIGLNEEESIKILQPLARATLENIMEKGISSAITGPIVRGDLGTIETHINQLRKSCPELETSYVMLGGRLANIASHLPKTDKKKLQKIRDFFHNSVKSPLKVNKKTLNTKNDS